MREVWLVLGTTGRNDDGRIYFPCLHYDLHVCEAGKESPVERVRGFVQGFSVLDNKPTITLTFLDDSTEECMFLGWVTGKDRSCLREQSNIAGSS